MGLVKFFNKMISVNKALVYVVMFYMNLNILIVFMYINDD